VHSIASGLDYPAVGPQHAWLKDLGCAEYHAINDTDCLDAFMTLSRVEGIIPALESSHAVAWAIQEAKRLGPDADILVNLSGRGDKNADFVANKLGRAISRITCAAHNRMTEQASAAHKSIDAAW